MRRLLAALAVLALTACISDSVMIAGTPAIAGGGTPSNSTSGVYTLRTVAGANLPYTFAISGADMSELMDDVITLTDANTWSEVWHERRTVSGATTIVALTDAGTFTMAPNGEITFLAPTHPGFSGTLNGGTLTLFGLSPTGQLVPQVFTK